jgi:hypothetical protein
MKSKFVPYDVSGFTFGFEVEGAFNYNLEDLLVSGGHFKQDGSVSVNDGKNPIDDDARQTCDNDSSYLASEYASPIFKNLDTAIEQLALFTTPNYYGNKSCGIHFHIGYKVKNALFNKFMDEPILNQLQKQFLPLVCNCIKERISGEGHHWCNLHEDFYKGFATTDKYKAVHFHTSYNTIELRLFAPCKHLMNNLRAVLTEFYRVGNRDYNHESEAICGIFNKDYKTEVSEVVTVEPRSYDYGFNKNEDFTISPLAMAEDFKEFERLQRDIESYHLANNYSRFRRGEVLYPTEQTC